MLQDLLEGLCPSPEPTHIYVELGKTEAGEIYPWHLFDPLANVQIPIMLPCIIGRLTGIFMKIQEFQNKEHFKIMFRVQSGDRTWFIRSGTETVFARGMILALSTLDDDYLAANLKFYAKPGDTAVYGNLYTAINLPVIAEFDKDRKLFPLISELQRRLGQEPQTVKQMQEEFQARKSGGRGNADSMRTARI